MRPAAAETVPIHAAPGHVLAEPIRARAVPAHAIALRAGWAVAAADTVRASSYTPALLRAAPRFVAIGAPLPDRTDAVLPPDALSGEAVIEVTAGVAPGEGARRVGEDAPAGAILREAGATVRARDAAIAHAAGITECTIRRARVRVIGEGAGVALIAERAAAWGAAVQRRSSGQDRARIRDPGADLVVVVGASDAPSVLGAADAPVAEALALRPGEGVACALAGSVPVIVVPDRLETALAAALLIVRPCLARLTISADEPTIAAPLVRKLVSGLGLTEVALLARTADGLFSPSASATSRSRPSPAPMRGSPSRPTAKASRPARPCGCSSCDPVIR